MTTMSRSHLSSRAKRGICSLLLLTAFACAPKGETKTDTTTLPAVDTLKTSPIATLDSIANAPFPAKTVPSGTKTGTATKTPRDSTILGRDSVIPYDPKKPRLDTVKKRPPG